MINRDNWKLTKKYLAYLADVKQLDLNTVHGAETNMRYLLEWLDETPVSKAMTVRPTFPRYVSDRLAALSVQLSCGSARRFFEWLRLYNKRIGRSIPELWIDSLAKPLTGIETRQYHEYTLDDVRALMVVGGSATQVQRDRAAIAFLFLSGMRIGAFVSMPIKAVDLGRSQVNQWPGLGVQTKRNKKATTFLLSIPELLAVVREWDGLVRDKLSGESFWYAPLDQQRLEIVSRDAGRVRHTRFAIGLRELCDLAGIEYRSPHALRHGFAVFGLKNAKDIADMEAVSKNLMHASLEVTLRVYAVLREGDVKDRIVNLGKAATIA